MNGSVSISIFMRSPVILAFSLPLIYTSWKWAAYSVDKVIMEVSATTVSKRPAKRVHTSLRRAVVTRGFPLLLIRSGRLSTWVYRCSTAGTMWSPKSPRYLPTASYMPVRTGTYQYIPVHTSTYQYIPVYPRNVIYVLAHTRTNSVCTHINYAPLV
jgi:hypothetical protein